MCGSHGFSSDVCMTNFVHGDLIVSLLFDDLSGHFYPFTFLMFLNFLYIHSNVYIHTCS